MKRILIAGGAGFIGSHLGDLFLAKGYQVICVDNLVTGSLNNVRHNLKNKNFSFIRRDICRPLQIKGPLFAVLNFASPASPEDYRKLPIETLMVGSLGTQNLLELARQKRARFILASTSEVYGDPLISPQKESYWGNVNSIGFRSCYDEAKRYAEAVTMAYHRQFGVDTRILRIFNTYGPRMRQEDGRVVPNFVAQALAGKPLTVYGNGAQTRSFCYVSDLVAGIYKLLLQDKFSADQLGRVFNLGNPGEFTIRELVQIFTKIIGRELRVKKMPLPPDDPKQRRPDISKARRVLGWRPTIDLTEGLKEVIRYERHRSL